MHRWTLGSLRTLPFAGRRRIVATSTVVVALASASLPMALPAPAVAATGDRTVSLTLTCTNNTCQGTWGWSQGGTGLGSGSISGGPNSTITGSTTQPAAADTLLVSVTSPPCGRGEVDSFTPGTPINIKVSTSSNPRAHVSASSASYTDSCQASFSMKS